MQVSLDSIVFVVLFAFGLGPSNLQCSKADALLLDA
jgi:hypothetical protein